MNQQIAQVLFGLFREDLGVNSSAAGVSWPPDVSTGFPMRVRGDFALRLAPVHRSLVRTSVREVAHTAGESELISWPPPRRAEDWIEISSGNFNPSPHPLSSSITQRDTPIQTKCLPESPGLEPLPLGHKSSALVGTAVDLASYHVY